MKKWSKLVLVTMVSVGTMLVSGCIDNIEPAGIANLRGAKAELLRAQTALQAAQAAKVEAEAALVLASSKVQEAIAKQEEARALMLQYQAELQQAQNEVEKAALEQRIAELQAQAAVTAENLKAQLLNAQAATAAAQAAYEQALKDLAIAKNTLTPEQATAITALEASITTARNSVETKTKALEDAAVALARAVANIDDSGNSTMIAGYEYDVVLAQAALEAAVEAEAEAKALLDVDKTLVDWDAKREGYQADLDSMSRAMLAYAEKYTAALSEVYSALENIEDKIEDYEDITGYKLDFDNSGNPYEWGTGLFSTIQGTIYEEIPVPDVQIKSDILGDFELIDETYEFGKEKSIIDEFDRNIMYYKYESEYYVHYNNYWNEIRQAELAKKEADPEYLAALERYEDAVAATKSGDYLAYFAKYEYTVENGYPEDYDFEAEVAKYNAALKAFKDGIAAYEAEEVRLTVDQIKYEQIDAAEKAERKAIESEKARGFQDAESKYMAAAAKHEKAYYVHEAAVTKRDRAIEAAEKAAGATEAEMETFEAGYVEAAATDEQKAKHAIYVKALADIKKARDAYQDPDPTVKTDPESVWAAAEDQWVKDKVLYDYNSGSFAPTSVYADIMAAYNDKDDDIDNKYGVIWSDFYANYPNFSAEYRADWTARLNALKTDLQNAVDALCYPVDEVIQGDADYDNVPYSVTLYTYNGSEDGVLALNIIDAPSFLCDKDGLVEVVAADLVDEDYFVWKDVQSEIPGELVLAAGNLWYDVDIEVDFVDGTNDSFTIYADDSAEWPYALPDYDTFVNIFLTKVKLENVDELDFLGGYGYLADIYAEKLCLEFDLAYGDEYYAAIPAYLEALEEAKAEFVAYVIEKEAELEAIKTEIEETVASVFEVVLPLYDEMQVQTAKYNVLSETMESLVNIIDIYVDTYGGDPFTVESLEDFEAAIKTAYDVAVEARIAAEESLAEAEWALEEAKAGNINAVEIAQVKYDRAVAELAEAIAKLNRYAASLEAILDAIYNDQPVPETPADPEGDEDAE